MVDPQKDKWYTVGDNGPEMASLPDNAIVFNHLQTEDLLKKGHTTNRGRALVSGNAAANTDPGGVEFIQTTTTKTETTTKTKVQVVMEMAAVMVVEMAAETAMMTDLAKRKPKKPSIGLNLRLTA